MRKTVTAVFCDVSGSTVLAGRLDPEVLRAMMEQYFASVSAVLARHGGTVEKFVGDAVMAVFGVPVAHEDDALRACRAAVEILAVIDEVDDEVEVAHGVRFGVRIGVETGEVVVGDASRGATFASGAAVNTAARLEQAAQPGQCLVGPGSFRLVRDRVVVEPSPGLMLPGIVGVVDAHRLVGIRADDGERPPQVPMVGRSRELALLGQSFDRAASDRTCQLATVLGPAGIGKSRLAHEFVTAVEEGATVLRGRCVSYGEGVTYWPLVQAVRQAVGLTGGEPEGEARAALARLLEGVRDAAEVVDRVAPVAGLGGAPGPPEDTAWAVQQLLERLASERPLVLVIDDLHWAEPGLLTVLEGLCDWSRDAPILVAVFARPEFLDDHPSWGAGRTNAVAALLEPLRDDEVDRLTGSLLGGLLPGDAANRVRAAAGGNPLFVEHLLAMLVEDGTLARDGAGWALAGDVTSLQIPPTITALLAARLDRLSAPERAVLAPAAVIGQVFYRGAVTELSTVPADQVTAHLRALVRKGLVRPTPSDLPGQEAFRFGHVLICDAAYGALPKAVRAELHERFARWLDKHYEGQSYHDFVGSHLESAYHLRAELGALDEPARELGTEAANRLETAARLLLFADDKAAIGLLERADALRTDEGPDRWALQIELARAWFRNAERLPQAAQIAEHVRRAAHTAGEARWAVLAGLVAAQVGRHIQPAGGTDLLRAVSFPAREMFTAADDHLGLSIAYQSLAEVANTEARSSDETHHMKLAAEHSELAGRSREAGFFRQLALAYRVYDDSPAQQGLQESRHQFSLAENRSGRSMTAACIYFFAALLGERDEAAKALDLSQRLAVGLHADVANSITMCTGLAELHTGRWPVAARLLADVCGSFREAGEIGFLSTHAAQHAHALLHNGEPEPARRQLELSQRIGGDDDVLNQGLIHGARAWLAALDGDRTAWQHHVAVATTALPDEQLLERALIHETCAEAASALGEHSVAHLHRQQALDLHRAKGNVVSVARLLQATR
jgi:class 3 adenylate cyclase